MEKHLLVSTKPREEDGHYPRGTTCRVKRRSDSSRASRILKGVQAQPSSLTQTMDETHRSTKTVEGKKRGRRFTNEGKEEESPG